jgi:hypothetical protein
MPLKKQDSLVLVIVRHFIFKSFQVLTWILNYNPDKNLVAVSLILPIFIANKEKRPWPIKYLSENRRVKSSNFPKRNFTIRSEMQAQPMKLFNL